MSVIIIPSDEFSRSIDSGNLGEAVAVIRLLETLRKFNLMLRLYISCCDYSSINSNNKLRILKEYLHSDIQIPFISVRDTLNCDSFVEINGNIPTQQFSKLFIKVINVDLQIPLVLTRESIQITKSKCEDCAHNSELCKNGFQLQFPPLESTTFEGLLKTLQEHNLDNQLISNKEFDQDSVRDLVKFFFQLIEFPGNQDILHSLEVCDSFIEDLNTSKDNKLEIVLSVARMMAHPPCSKKKRSHRYSIDWHPDPIQVINIGENRYDIYRLDVLDSLTKKGLKKSGSNRVLFGKIEGRTVLISFTETHSFNKEEACNRIEQFEESYHARST